MDHSPARPIPTSALNSRPRHDGWTVERQVAFIQSLRLTGCVARAAAAAGMSREGAYRLRKRPGHAHFARAWNAALATHAAAKGHVSAVEGHAYGLAQPARSVGKVTKVTPRRESRRTVKRIKLRRNIPAKGVPTSRSKPRVQ